MHHFKMKIRI